MKKERPCSWSHKYREKDQYVGCAFRIPPEVHKKLKIVCCFTDKKMCDIFIELVINYLETEEVKDLLKTKGY